MNLIQQTPKVLMSKLKITAVMFLKQLQNKKGKKYQALMIFELMTCAKLLYRRA